MPHVLIVDDDRECLTALSNRLRFAFRNHAVKVDSADCATTGLILAYQRRYDALVVDVCMPRINGIKFVEQLRRTQPSVPIIMMSGGDITACQDQPARLGLMACLVKPLEFGTLLNLLAELLDLANQAANSQLAANHQKGRLGVGVKKAFGHRRSSARYARLNIDDQRLHTS